MRNRQLFLAVAIPVQAVIAGCLLVGLGVIHHAVACDAFRLAAIVAALFCVKYLVVVFAAPSKDYLEHVRLRGAWNNMVRRSLAIVLDAGYFLLQCWVLWSLTTWLSQLIRPCGAWLAAVIAFGLFAYLAFAAYIACRALRFDIICCSFFPRESLRWFPMPKSVAEGIARNNDDGASSAQHGIGASDEEMRQARAAKKAALIRLLKIYLIEIVCLVLFVVIVVSAKNAAMKKRKARSQESESRHVQCDERRGTPPLSSLCAA